MPQTEKHRSHREGTENTESLFALRACVGGTLSRLPWAGRDDALPYAALESAAIRNDPRSSAAYFPKAEQLPPNSQLAIRNSPLQ